MLIDRCDFDRLWRNINKHGAITKNDNRIWMSISPLELSHKMHFSLVENTKMWNESHFEFRNDKDRFFERRWKHCIWTYATIRTSTTFKFRASHYAYRFRSTKNIKVLLSRPFCVPKPNSFHRNSLVSRPYHSAALRSHTCDNINHTSIIDENISVLLVHVYRIAQLIYFGCSKWLHVQWVSIFGDFISSKNRFRSAGDVRRIYFHLLKMHLSSFRFFLSSDNERFSMPKINRTDFTNRQRSIQSKIFLHIVVWKYSVFCLNQRTQLPVAASVRNRHLRFLYSSWFCFIWLFVAFVILPESADGWKKKLKRTKPFDI